MATVAVEAFIRAAARTLVNINPTIPLEVAADDDTHVTAYWCSSPEFFVVEWVIAHALLVVPGLCTLPWLPWHVLSSAKQPHAARKPTCASAALDFVELLCSLTLLLSCVTLAYFKVFVQPMAYICMLCHLHSFFLVYLRFVAPANDTSSRLLHAGFIPMWWGTVMALAAPDLRDLGVVETVHFFVEHVLLLVLPALWIAQRRFTHYSGLYVALTGWLACLAVHYNAMFPVSLLHGANVGYVLAPPDVGALKATGQWYRVVMVAVWFVLAFVCVGAARLIAWATGAAAAAAAEQEGTASAGGSSRGSGSSSGGGAQAAALKGARLHAD